MRNLYAFSAFRASSLVFGLSAAFALSSACSSDDAVSKDGAGGAAAGEANAAAGGDAMSEAGGLGNLVGAAGAVSATGGNSDAAAGGATSTSEAGSSASAGAAAGGAPSVGGDCYVAFTNNTSNAVDLTVPLSECKATNFGEQINFEAVLGPLAARDLSVDFFAPAVAGASVKLEDGYDFAAHRGAAASYVDSAGVWNADSGTVTIVSVVGDKYVVTLKDVHFAVLSGQPVEPTATGAFLANGTITATAVLSK